MKINYPFLRDLKLADSGKNKLKINLVIGVYFHGSVVGRALKKRDDMGPVALGSRYSSCLETHTKKNSMQISRFKKLKTFGI